eukprot:gene2683-5280_t
MPCKPDSNVPSGSPNLGTFIGQSVMGIFDGILKRFDGSPESTPKEHIPIKPSSLPMNESIETAEAKMDNLTNISKETSSLKEKNISKKTKQMLMKTKAVGNPNIPIDDRFYINIYFTLSKHKIPMYFTSYAIIGEVLEHLARNSTQLAFVTATRPEHASLCFQKDSKPWKEWNRRKTISEEMEDFDDVEVITMSTFEITENQMKLEQKLNIEDSSSTQNESSTSTSVEINNNESSTTPSDNDNNDSNVNITYKKGDRVMYIPSTGESEEAIVMAIHLDDVPSYYTIRMNSGREKQTVGTRLQLIERAPSTSTSTKSTGISSNSSTKGGLTIEVSQGTKIRNIEGIQPEQSVLELKRILEKEFGVPAFQQKLIFKGTVLKDHQKINQTKITNGSK